MKINIKQILIAIIFLPFILIALFILSEIVGMAVNSSSGNRQTKNLTKMIESELPSAKIIDSYTETGNTTGTGNHVDMLSVVIFTATESLTEIEKKLEPYYETETFWMADYWIGDIEEFKILQEEYRFLYNYLYKIDTLENAENCYLLYLCQEAPFPNNIEGH